ncbi:unnamed protein product [Cuscuta epithymum]|uniref:Uncharacterized protein n=1 Tax=Cuscuta epithymum TaxID=186058 RepID=A0AAV0EA91_9ASTE|nr:unnamed protein product [Cuscuta epithymum]CAH9118647.1 unnamed protein product [Cuscuta epithymum]
MVADRGKKSKVADAAQDDESNPIDQDLVLSVERLQEVQDELEKVNEQASDDVLEVEQKYNEIRRPVYDKRNEVIKSIPDFWLIAFMSHPALSDLLCDEDQKVFKYFDSLYVEDFKDLASGYSITFTFKKNPYFEDTKLVKTFTFHEEGTRITGTEIKWKEGMGVPNGCDQEKKGNKRPPPEESFFSWFSETQPKDIAEGLSDEVAEIIKEDLWPNPLKYFNNEADEEDSDGDEDDEDGKDEDEEDVEEEEE